MEVWDQIHVFFVDMPEGSVGMAAGASTGGAIQVQDSLEIDHGQDEIKVGLANGTTRNATEEERKQILEKEKMDAEEAELERQGDEDRWNRYQAA